MSDVRCPWPAWKRILDIMVAATVLLLAALPLLLAAVFIKCVSRGPVLFKQQRLGYLGRPFTFLKLRSMQAANDQAAHQWHVQELFRSGVPMKKLDAIRDPRIIPGGRLLRGLCLDELPQFLNVLRGQMSVVGPRPCLPYEAELFHGWQRERFQALPGITGLWQVSGKNALSFEQMLRLDVQYVRQRSLRLDLGILLATPAAVLKEAIGAGSGWKRQARPVANQQSRRSA